MARNRSRSTTTASCQSSDSSQPTASDLLAAAAQIAGERRPAGWLGKLSREHLLVVVAARDQWRAARGGVAATHLAQTIRERFAALGYSVPSTDRIASWLTERQ